MKIQEDLNVVDFDKKKPKQQEKNSNIFFWITFDWFTPLIWKGFKKSLEMEDLYNLKSQDEASNISKKFDKNWYTYKSPNKRVFKTLVKTFGFRFFLAGFLKLISDLCELSAPLFLGRILAYISDPTPAIPYEGFIWAGGLFLTKIIAIFALQHYFHIVMNVGMRIRSALTAALYKKALKLSNGARGRKTTGEIVNLMSVDATKLLFVVSYLHMIWSSIIQMIVCLTFLFIMLGWAAIGGIIIMILLIPLQAVLARVTFIFRKRVLKFTDKRIKTINEMLSGIRIIKFFTWETSFLYKITKIRQFEVIELLWSSLTRGVLSTIMSASPTLVSVTTFVLYAAFGNTLNAQIIFPAIAYFNLLRFPLTFFPMIIGFVVDANVSLNRLNSFLTEEEIEDPKKGNNVEIPIIIKDGNFEWDKVISESDNNKKETIKESLIENDELNKDGVGKLSNINLEIKKGELCIIVGEVGSGKSSIVQSIINEMPKINGTVSTTGSIAYAAQQAWIQNATVKDNITFGMEYDEEKFNNVVEVTALKHDIKILNAGIETEIGEKGINLSGGQRQRISIARAVYCNSDIYILDDPLSAVDAHVGKHIFDKCINGYIKNKTRLLVTHQLQYLKYADKIIVLKDGKIAQQGTYDELSKNKGILFDLLEKYLAKETDEDHKNNKINEESRLKLKKETQEKEKFEEIELEKKVLTPEEEEDLIKIAEEQKKKGKLIQKEERVRGTVSLKVIWGYIQVLGGIPVLLILAFIFITSQASVVLADWWLSQWSSNVFPHIGVELNLAIFASLGIIGSIFIMLRSLSFLFFGIIASNKLHYRALRRVLKAPMSFFDSTPVGRMLNRFSKDQETADSVLIQTLTSFIVCIFQVVSTFAIVIYVTPLYSIPLVPMLIVYYAIQQFYRRTSRELKRLDSISRSPLFAHFSESLTGLPTIRAYDAQENFIKQNQLKLDNNQKPYYCQIVSQRWLAFRLEIIGAILIFFAGTFAILGKGTLSDGLIGLSLTYSLQVTSYLSWAVRQATEAETSMNSIERLLHYVNNIEKENPSIIKDNRTENSWPSEGKIKFNDFKLKYRKDLPLVIKGITFSIKAGEKIGVVGRTGAGKSTIMLALYRFIESAGGNIEIDGEDISKIGTFDLRKSISIIPQEPLLFAGTVRFNLDPFNEMTDDKLWDALKKAHLKKVIKKLKDELNAPVAEGGENFSVGQRQLMCLARALVKKTKILLLDEATASVDLKTDDLIQKTVKEEFSDCTQITIAHRLNTIIDMDRILVLDKGLIAEYDTPRKLCMNKESLFYGMLNETGSANKRMLLKIALSESKISEEEEEENEIIEIEDQERISNEINNILDNDNDESDDEFKEYK